MMFDRTLSLYDVHAFPYFLKREQVEQIEGTMKCKIIVSPLVPLVDLSTADHEHEGGDDREVVWHQVCEA